MMHRTANHRTRSRAVSCLLLALLLAIAPLLAVAGGARTSATNNDAPGTLTQMPCHADAAQLSQTPDLAQQEACPHCTADAPASQCHCCGYAAPAGLTGLAGASLKVTANEMPARLAATKALPKSSGDRLYRPPIFHS